MKFLVLFPLFFSLTAFAQNKSESCIDISVFKADAKSPEELTTVRESDNLKEVLLSLRNQVSFCVLKGLERDPELEPYSKKNFPLGLKIKVSEDGKLNTQCECESYIRTSSDIKEARYRLLIGSCYSQVASRQTMPKTKKISSGKTFCWDGTIAYKVPGSKKLPTVKGVN